MSETQTSEQHRQQPGRVWPLVISWGFMIALTIVAFVLVGFKLVATHVVIPIILAFAFVQVVMQVYLFMHLNDKSQRYQMIFMITGLIFGIIFAVGIWDMSWRT